MNGVYHLGSQTVSGLRTRYFPKSRIGHGLISVAPWANLVLLIAAFAFVEGHLSVQPCVEVSLPAAEFLAGVRTPLVAVVLSAQAAGTAAKREVIFFDDERFLPDSDEEMKRLQDKLAAAARRERAPALILQADRRVQHGTLVRLMELAREVGIYRVALGVKQQ